MSSVDSRRDHLLHQIYGINAGDFADVAMELWRYQFDYNDVYREFCRALNCNPDNVQFYQQIPFLPISSFREHLIKTGSWEPEIIFRSSGTTNSSRSQHAIQDLAWYHRMAHRSFQTFFGDPGQYTWIGLLPSYLERKDSSLVDMVHYFMQQPEHATDYFFPEINRRLIEVLQKLFSEQKKTILIGVSFALLDLFENYNIPDWEQLFVIETGGMKGRRAELTREELHQRIRHHHPKLNLYSEYGMTELMSQAYWIDGHFRCSPTMRISVRDISDPFSEVQQRRGTINVIDLGNIDTCAFIATDDVGMVYPDGSFDVLGRLDEAELRGCNLMYR